MISVLPVPFPYVWTTDRDAQAAFNRARALGGDANVRMIHATTRLLKGAGVWGMVQGLWLPGEVCTLDDFGKSGNLIGLRGAGGIYRDALQPLGSLQQTRMVDPLLGPVIRFESGWYQAPITIAPPVTLVYVGHVPTAPSSASLLYDGSSLGGRMPVATTSGNWRWQIAGSGASPTVLAHTSNALGAQAALFQFNQTSGAIRAQDSVIAGPLNEGSSPVLTVGARYNNTGYGLYRLALAAVIAGDIGPLDGDLANRLMQALYTLYPATRP